MKFNFKFNSILLILLISLFASCKEEDVSLQQEEKIFSKEVLSKDVNFIHFVDMQKNMTNQFEKKIQSLTKIDREKSIKQLQEIGNSNNLTEKDSREVAVILGFNRYEDYILYRQDVGKTVESLRKSYSQLKSMNTKSQPILEDAISMVISKNKALYKQQNLCGDIYDNCIGSSYVRLGAASLACALFTLSPVTALVAVPCEALAIADHYYAAQSCGLTYRQCK